MELNEAALLSIKMEKDTRVSWTPLFDAPALCSCESPLFSPTANALKLSARAFPSQFYIKNFDFCHAELIVLPSFILMQWTSARTEKILHRASWFRSQPINNEKINQSVCRWTHAAEEFTNELNWWSKNLWHWISISNYYLSLLEILYQDRLNLFAADWFCSTHPQTLRYCLRNSGMWTTGGAQIQNNILWFIFFWPLSQPQTMFCIK